MTSKGFKRTYTFLARWAILAFILPKSLNDIFATSTSLSGIFIGFLITAKSILFSIDDRSIIKKLKQTKTYVKLINYFMSAITYSFFLAFISLLSLFIDFNKSNVFNEIIFLFWIFGVILTGSSCYRVISVFSKILVME